MSNISTEKTFVDVPGGKVFVCQWRPASATTNAPVILLHDSLGCVALWRDFPESLAHCLRRPVIAYDRLGFGQSTARRELPSVNFIREEAEVFFPPLLNASGVNEFALFGHSVGGAMALLIAASSGSRCQAVITEAAQPYVEPLTLTSIRAGKEQFSQPEQLNRLTKYHGEKSQWVVNAWTEVWLAPAFASWSLEADLGKVQCPVLALHGELDEYGSVEFPRRIVSGVISGAKGRAEMMILKGCGHIPHRERKEEVLNLTSQFLAHQTE
jgi:pimeloyl-ACP methyl ester carboxylesterase